MTFTNITRAVFSSSPAAPKYCFHHEFQSISFQTNLWYGSLSAISCEHVYFLLCLVQCPVDTEHLQPLYFEPSSRTPLHVILIFLEYHIPQSGKTNSCLTNSFDIKSKNCFVSLLLHGIKLGLKTILRMDFVQGSERSPTSS